MSSSSSGDYLLRAIESDLVTISQEAKKGSAIKDSAERCLLELRALVAKAIPLAASPLSPLPSISALPPDIISSLKAQWLQPFLIASNHVDAPRRVLTVALSAIQRLITAGSGGILLSDYHSISRVLEIQVRYFEFIVFLLCHLLVIYTNLTFSISTHS
jgi:hypothetical protein